ncbi:hypothetical protein [Mangrovimonas sp. DI 80]|uniref:hypothetical protein n=1 Tax=Mangrovimonas sp. DI 80 TaxID=1779330 RepID=UPI0009766F27|nr:hypothetical protein [Mangrovimonas sp. DI 80]OMP31675.1 hypothetical protein BKM32_00990 [Mangrovimonas sp. DI 80]
MSFIKKSSQSIFIGGLFFMVPTLILIMLFGKALKLILPLAKALSNIFDLHSVFGTASVTLMSLVLLFLICAGVGLLLQRGFLTQWNPKTEQRLFFHFPAFQMLKYRLLDEKKLKNSSLWKAILLKEDSNFTIGFITDDTHHSYLTLYLPDAPKMDAGQIKYVLKSNCEYYPITMKQAMNALHDFGKCPDLTQLLSSIKASKTT